MFAGYFGNVELVTFLVTRGADPALKNNKGESVLNMNPCMSATRENIFQAINEGNRYILYMNY